ncbi:MAG: LD-carboxypeptidase [Polyangiaceae bacterium]
MSPLPAPVVFPPALRPGDTIAVVAPSSAFEAVLGWRGLGFLAERYRLRFDRRALFARAGYLAGSDAQRREALSAALRDPDAVAILAARGGYGANRFVHELDFAGLRGRPRWIIGFSDVTALHVEAARAGVASIHGCHLTSLGRADRRAREGLLSVLEAPQRRRTIEGLDTLAPGRAHGPLFGGNLTILHACAAAGRLAVPEGAILFIEDVTERPYRIDRMLTTLAVGGHFDRVAGVLIGDFTQCDPGPDRITVKDVLRERLADLGVPIATGAPCGHGTINDPLILGAPTLLEASDTSASAVFFP